MNNECYPSINCPGCRRNLYRLKKGVSPYGELEAKVAKVYLMIFTLPFSLFTFLSNNNRFYLII